MNAPVPPLRLAIVDDSELVRIGLRTLLEAKPGLAIVGEAATARDAIALCARHAPDVVLLDVHLPDGTGPDVCRRVLATAPETRVLFLTSSADEAMVDAAIRAGAHGYLLKEIDSRALVHAIHAVAAGESILDPVVTARLAWLKTSSPETRAALASLSPQERRVLAAISEGHTNKEAAAELGLAEKTVKNYLSTVFEKLHVSSRSQAAALCKPPHRDARTTDSGPNGRDHFPVARLR